ncbi:MAG: ABC transporter ATP-binding protein [Candidatus Coproplasma sp.]
MDERFNNTPAEPFEEFNSSSPASPQPVADGTAAGSADSSSAPVSGGESLENTRPRAPLPDENAPVILECRNLTKLYGNNPALTDVNFAVKAGGVVGLLGPNGSGKSTLIKLAMGMLQPNNGEILIDGKKPSPETKAITAYLPDANYLSDWMTVDKQVKYCADFFSDFNLLKAEGLLSRLGISGKQKIKTLSKGNKEKLGLILTMARDAKLYILDEPIAGVDPAAREFILDTVMTNRAEGSTIFLCTHLIADIEPILTHAIFLNRGTVALDKSVEEVKAQEGKSLDELFREVFRW